jgi:adenylate kinase
MKKDKSTITQEKPQKTKFEELKEREKKMLETKSQVLRAFLLQKVIPIMSQGILDVCQNLPEDPVEHLADYLENLIINKEIK